ncbi:MAG: peptidoglycan DD-metalloendopeptidase family protein [Synechococcales bacterium]|nr:peptidoglycan DD-metalloendopeptidase family protein [Synechococcales bacterium]
MGESSGEPTAVRVLPVAEVTEPSAPRAVIPSPGTGVTQHIVREGETLWNLANQYRISPDALAAANHLTTDNVLQVGQTIKIPANAAASSAQSTTHPSASAESAKPAVGQNLAQLQVLNAADALATPRAATLPESSRSQTPGSSDLSTLKEDSELSSAASETELPASILASEAGEAIAESPTTNSSATAEPEFSVAATATLQPIPAVGEADLSSSSDSHRIKPGETLASIARQHGISVEALAEANGIRNFNRIFAGRMLVIPAAAPSSPPVAIAPPTNPVVVVAAASETFNTVLPFAAEPTGASSAASFPTPESITAPTVPNRALDTEAAQFKVPDVQPDSAPDRLTIAQPDAPSETQVAALSESGSETHSLPQVSANPYVENLMSEIEALSEHYETSSQDDADVADIAPATVAAILSVPPDIQYLQSGNAVNPEFNRPVEAPEAATVDEGEPTDDAVQPVRVSTTSNHSTPGRSEQLVAVAPLGSENYVPLGQPVTGRMVSPELPPLPGPDHYLPNGSGRFNGYLWPARGVLTSGYGWRWGRMHQGIDIAAPVGTPIYAAAPGVIEFSGWNSGGYGNMVDIRHPDGSKTRYAHNSRNLVRVGQQVQQGQQIAEMGSTGYSTGPHVHFEVHLPNQGTVNPVAYLPQNR